MDLISKDDSHTVATKKTCSLLQFETFRALRKATFTFSSGLLFSISTIIQNSLFFFTLIHVHFLIWGEKELLLIYMNTSRSRNPAIMSYYIKKENRNYQIDVKKKDSDLFKKRTTQFNAAFMLKATIQDHLEPVFFFVFF